VFPDGRRVATGTHGGKLAVWDAATGRLLAERSVGTMSWLVPSRDGGVLFAFAETGTTGWLLTGDLSRVVPLEHNAGLNDATFSPDGARLATLGLDGVRIWNRGGQLEARLDAGAATAGAWSSDGSWLVIGTKAGTLTIWDRSTWRARKTVQAHANYIRALAIDDHDTLIASVGGDGTVKLWEMEQLLQVARIATGEFVHHLAFERDRILISGPLGANAWRSEPYGD
jgi:WD40 repeat protein